MAQIWKEEHETAVERLETLHIQQRMQAIADLENCGVKKNENYILSHMKPIVPKTLIVKANFQPSHPLTERTSNRRNNEKEIVEEKLQVVNNLARIPLRFRRGVSPESLRSNMKQVASNINSNKLEEARNMSSSAVIFRRDQPQVNKQAEKFKLKLKEFRSDSNDDVISKELLSSQRMSSSGFNITLSNTSSKDYPIKFIKERQDFLNKEREVAQQKFFERSSSQVYKRVSRSNSTQNERIINIAQYPNEKSFKIPLEKALILNGKRQYLDRLGSDRIETKAYKDDFFERIGSRVTNSETLFIQRRRKNSSYSGNIKPEVSKDLGATELAVNVSKVPILVHEKLRSQKERWNKTKIFGRRSSDFLEMRNSRGESNMWKNI